MTRSELERITALETQIGYLAADVTEVKKGVEALLRSKTIEDAQDSQRSRYVGASRSFVVVVVAVVNAIFAAVVVASRAAI